MENIIFTNTTTIGIRHINMERTVLDRRMDERDTPYGKVKVKVVSYYGKVVGVFPEYESVADICRKTGAPFTAIYNSAIGG